MQNIKEAFGANLRKIRKSRKFTLDAFAEMADITPRLLSKIEAGDTFLSVETLCKISMALDLSLQVLFDFEWNDGKMYFDNNKYIKPHFKAVIKDDKFEFKSLPTLKGFNIHKQMSISEFTLFMMDFAKNNNMTVYVDCFINKTRDKIVKYSPDNTFSFLATRNDIMNKENNTKDALYYDVIEKFKEFSTDKTKIEYIKTAMEALNNKKALEKLKTMIKGIEISQ